VQKNGLVDLEALRAAVTDKTVVRLDHGGEQRDAASSSRSPRSARSVREKKAFFHTDAAQGVGKIPLDVEAMNIDLMSISGHKIYGPKGIGQRSTCAASRAC